MEEQTNQSDFMDDTEIGKNPSRNCRYNQIKTKLQKLESDEQAFKRQLSTSFEYQGREWTYGQFLYKYFYDQFEPLLKLPGYDKSKKKEVAEREQLITSCNLADYTQTENKEEALQEVDKLEEFIRRSSEIKSELDKKIIAEQKEKGRKLEYVDPSELYDYLQRHPETDLSFGLISKEKADFYYNLLIHNASSQQTEQKKNNPEYLHPLFFMYTSFIESRLKKMGFSEQHIKWFMEHCQEKRKEQEKKSKTDLANMEMTHASLYDLDHIEPKPRADDQGVRLSKFAFVCEKGHFHPGTPVKNGGNRFRLYPRFNPQVMIFQVKRGRELESFSDAFIYSIAQAENSKITPVIPMWGGPPMEYVSKEPLSFEGREKETLLDLIRKGKDIYIFTGNDDDRRKLFASIPAEMSPELINGTLKRLSQTKKFRGKIRKVNREFLEQCALKKLSLQRANTGR